MPLNDEKTAYTALWQFVNQFTAGVSTVNRADFDTFMADLISALNDTLVRLQVNEQAQIASATDLSTTTLNTSVQSFRTRGRATDGDGGAATYRRVAAEPSHVGKLQDASGAWFEIAEPIITSSMLGSIDAAVAVAASQGVPCHVLAGETAVVTIGSGGMYASLSAALAATESWIAAPDQLIHQYVSGTTQETSVATVDRAVRIRGHQASSLSYLAVTVMAVSIGARSGDTWIVTATVSQDITALAAGMVLYMDGDQHSAAGDERSQTILTGPTLITGVDAANKQLTLQTFAAFNIPSSSSGISLSGRVYYSAVEFTPSSGSAITVSGSGCLTLDDIMLTASTTGINGVQVKGGSLKARNRAGFVGFNSGVTVDGGHVQVEDARLGVRGCSTGVLLGRGAEMDADAIDGGGNSTGFRMTNEASAKIGTIDLFGDTLAAQISGSRLFVSTMRAHFGGASGFNVADEARVRVNTRLYVRGDDAGTGVFASGVNTQVILPNSQGDALDKLDTGIRLTDGASIYGLSSTQSGAALSATSNLLPNITYGESTFWRTEVVSPLGEGLQAVSLADGAANTYILSGLGAIDIVSTSGDPTARARVFIAGSASIDSETGTGTTVTSGSPRLTGSSGAAGQFNINIRDDGGVLKMDLENRRGATGSWGVRWTGMFGTEE